MNQATKQANPLIYDRAMVPWRRRIFQKGLDIVAWAGWLLLWMPVLLALYQLIFGQYQINDPIFKGLWQHASLGFAMFVGMWLLFIGWTKLMHRRVVMRRRNERRQKKAGLCPDKLAHTFSLDRELLLGWQAMQVMIAHHAEDTGWLHQIEATQAA
jgi:poly-beta-1,6-N-acetyl-D-glucosamine biosynthesis protein PgaD